MCELLLNLLFYAQLVKKSGVDWNVWSKFVTFIISLMKIFFREELKRSAVFINAL